MILDSILLALNVLFMYINYQSGHYKSAMFSSVAAGVALTGIVLK